MGQLQQPKEFRHYAGLESDVVKLVAPVVVEMHLNIEADGTPENVAVLLALLAPMNVGHAIPFVSDIEAQAEPFQYWNV